MVAEKVGNFVTPYVGVWIEIINSEATTPEPTVTPYVGVWIEIMI